MLRLANLFQCKAAADHERGTFHLHQLLFLELGKQSADRLARRPDDLGNFLVGQRELDLRRTVVLRGLARPGEQQFRKFFRRRN